MSNSEKLKRYLFFCWSVYQFIGGQSDHKGRSGNISHIFHPLCSQPEL